MSAETNALETALDSPAVTTEQVTTQTDDTAAPNDVSTQAEKTFTQAELDDAIQKRLSKAARQADRRVVQAYREALEKVAPVQPQTEKKPSRADFNGNDEAWAEALTDWKIDQRDRQQGQQRQQEAQRESQVKTEKIYSEAEKLPGFDREVFDDLPLTPTIAKTIIGSDIPARLMAWASSNPDAIAKIAKLDPDRQAAEIGRLEEKLSVPKPKDPPPPPRQVGGGGTVNNGKLENMSQDEYVKTRRAQGARY